MAYRKVRGTQGAGPLESGELQTAALELDWDLEEEEEELQPQEAAGPAARDRLTPQRAQRPRPPGGGGSPSRTDPDPDLMEPSVSVSPHGRFERLQEDPNYISHFTRAQSKGQRKTYCHLVRYFLVAAGIFILGILIGHYAHAPDGHIQAPPTDTTDLLEEMLRGITADKIQALHRSFSSLSEDSEEARVKYLRQQWAGMGLTDVQLSNYSVLLSLPGPAPSTIVDRSERQCFLPNGAPCTGGRGGAAADQHYSYGAYSATGSLEAEVLDVQYGSPEDLTSTSATMNVTNRIALLKLGQAPLLYKLSLLLELGFGGALVYVDPCDSPGDQTQLHQAFGVTLNPGGDPSTPGYPSIVGSYREQQTNLTSLLVQPISASLAKRLLSVPSVGMGGRCTPLATPSGSEKKRIVLTISSRWEYRPVYNVVGYLRGKTNPDRYVLVGGRHDSWHPGSAADWRGGSAIMTQLIATATEQARRGWAPDRTTVFCSWGGSALGNIGSFEWGEEYRVVLLSNAVAYVSLDRPVRGTETLQSTSSPSLLQLTSDIQKRQLLSCIRGGNCPGPSVSSLQFPGDVRFFANQIAVPTVEFSFQQTTSEEKTSFLSEAQFPAASSETLDPLFKFHETIAKMTAEAVFRLVNDPVLPISPLDIALDVQNKLKDDRWSPPGLLASAASLRESSAFLQSEAMRPANDPKERDPAHVRMLNDVLRDLEKSFLVPRPPPGVYRNLLYSLPGRTPRFSILLLAQDAVRPPPAAKHAPDPPVSRSVNQSLSLITNAVVSAQRLVLCGLDLFENNPDDTI